MWLSRNDSKTWSKSLPILPKGMSNQVYLNATLRHKVIGSAYYGAMVQLNSGRLLLPSRIAYWGEHPGMKRAHALHPEIDIGLVSYSDDEGKT